jgi:DNA polymerase I-like protein with 3'-5' exonuclease and polymerase domains
MKTIFRKSKLSATIAMTADFAALEARVMATVTKQPEDAHIQTAAEFFCCKPEEVTPEMRAVGKQLNYSKLYNNLEALCVNDN